MSRDWETPRVQKLSVDNTEGGSSLSFSEFSIYKTGS